MLPFEVTGRPVHRKEAGSSHGISVRHPTPPHQHYQLDADNAVDSLNQHIMVIPREQTVVGMSSYAMRKQQKHSDDATLEFQLQPRLLRVKASKAQSRESGVGHSLPHKVRILEEVLRWESLDDAGFFILDTGLEIFTFQGTQCNPWEKFIGASVAQAMRDEPQRVGSMLYILDEWDLSSRENDYDVEALGLLLGRFGRPVRPASKGAQRADSDSDEEIERQEIFDGENTHQKKETKPGKMDNLMKSPFAKQLRHTAPDDVSRYPMRLLHVKGRKKVRVWKVPVDWSSLNQGDFFVLDTGNEVFQFQGSKANPWEKFIGGGVANNLRNERSVYTSKLPELYIIDEKDLDRRCHDMDVQRFCMLLNREQRGIAPPLADDVDCPSEAEAIDYGGLWESMEREWIHSTAQPTAQQDFVPHLLDQELCDIEVPLAPAPTPEWRSADPKCRLSSPRIGDGRAESLPPVQPWSPVRHNNLGKVPQLSQLNRCNSTARLSLNDSHEFPALPVAAKFRIGNRQHSSDSNEQHHKTSDDKVMSAVDIKPASSGQTMAAECEADKIHVRSRRRAAWQQANAKARPGESCKEIASGEHPSEMTLLCPRRNPGLPTNSRLHNEILRLCASIRESLCKQENDVKCIVQGVQEVAQQLWESQPVAVMYGSRQCGMAITSSDVDVVITGLGSHDADPLQWRSVAADLTRQLATSLLSVSWVQSVQAIDSASMPVVKARSTQSGLEVDISFMGAVTTSTGDSESAEHNLLVHSGHAMTTLLSDYVSWLPSLQPLCVVLKLFLREQGLNRPYSGGLASVSLMCMLIAYLRQPNVNSCQDADLGDLLLRFLDFFGNGFCYASTGISIHAGFFARLPGEGDQAAIFVDDPLRHGEDMNKPPAQYFSPPSNLAASSFNIASVATAFQCAHTRWKTSCPSLLQAPGTWL